jgi:hypothetical protein
MDELSQEIESLRRAAAAASRKAVIKWCIRWTITALLIWWWFPRYPLLWWSLLLLIPLGLLSHYSAVSLRRLVGARCDSLERRLTAAEHRVNQTAAHEASRWDEAKRRFPVGSRVQGTVVDHRPFGIFVDVGDPVALGLVSITDFCDEGRMTVEQYPPIGSSIEAVVLGHTNDGRKQIWLGLKPSQLRPIA